MKSMPVFISALAALLLSGFGGFWQDQVHEVGATVVSIEAIGSDVRLVQVIHREEAVKLLGFADTYNRIAYNSERTQAETCNDLQQAGLDAIEKRESSFAGLHEVNCFPAAGSPAPRLQMIIYPQTRHDYRFHITFSPAD